MSLLQIVTAVIIFKKMAQEVNGEKYLKSF